MLPPRPLQTSRVTMVWPTEHETSELVSVSDDSKDMQNAYIAALLTNPRENSQYPEKALSLNFIKILQL